MQRLDDILVDESNETLSVDLCRDATASVPSQHHSGVHPEQLGELSGGKQFHACWYMTVTTSHTVRLIPRRMASVIFMTTVDPLRFPILSR